MMELEFDPTIFIKKVFRFKKIWGISFMRFDKKKTLLVQMKKYAWYETLVKLVELQGAYSSSDWKNIGEVVIT